MEVCKGCGNLPIIIGALGTLPKGLRTWLNVIDMGEDLRLTESMHTGIGTYSQKSTGDARLRKHLGILASKPSRCGSLQKETSPA